MIYSYLAILVGYLFSLAIMWGTFSYNPNEASSVLFIPILLFVIAVVSFFVSFMCVKKIANQYYSLLVSMTLNNLIYLLGIVIFTQINDGKAGFNNWLVVAIVVILTTTSPIAISSWVAAKLWQKRHDSA